MPKQLRIFPEKCIGCKSCELACSLVNEGEMNPSRSRITMIAFVEGRCGLPYNIPLTCRQCADAPCLEACPVDAILRSRDTMKTIIIDYKTCINCGKCVDACPFGAMFYDGEDRRPLKCELCGGEPACVSICPSEAILFVQRRPFYAKPQALEREGFSILSKRNRQKFQESES